MKHSRFALSPNGACRSLSKAPAELELVVPSPGWVGMHAAGHGWGSQARLSQPVEWGWGHSSAEIYAEKTVFVGNMYLPFTWQAHICSFCLSYISGRNYLDGSRAFLCLLHRKRNAMQRRVTAEHVTQGGALHVPVANTFDVFFRKLSGQGEALPAIIQAAYLPGLSL